jgi:hypothetical protein
MLVADHREPDESGPAFEIVDIVSSNRFPWGNAERCPSSSFTLEYLLRTGFRTPLLFEERRHLGLVVPDPSFSVSDVERLVGSGRVLDVMDCSTQEALAMKMRDWTTSVCAAHRRAPPCLPTSALTFALRGLGAWSAAGTTMILIRNGCSM